MRFPLPRLSVLAALLTAFVLAPGLTGQQALAQEVSEADKQQYYQIYVTDFRSDNYQGALRNWRWIMENAPTYPQGDDRNYRRGFESYMGLAGSATGEQKRAYVDSALAIAERVGPEVRDAGGEVDDYQWLRRRARAIHENVGLFENGRARATSLFREMYDRKPAELDPWYLDQIIRGYYSQSDKEGAVAFLEELEANRDGDEAVQDLLDKWYPQFLDSPDERIAFLEEKLAEEPESGEIMEQLLTLYQQTGQSDEVSRMQTRILESDPTPSLYRTVASTRLDDGEPQKAFELYERMLASPETEATAQDYYNMGIAKEQMNQLAGARTYYRRAINTDSGFGSAYLAIGNLYAKAVSQCSGGSDLSFEDRAVYWLAADYYQRARSNDSSVASAANQALGQYREYYPSKDNTFFKGMNEGDSYAIDYGCYSWIGETTTVKDAS